VPSSWRKRVRSDLIGRVAGEMRRVGKKKREKGGEVCERQGRVSQTLRSGGRGGCVVDLRKEGSFD